MSNKCLNDWYKGSLINCKVWKLKNAFTCIIKKLKRHLIDTEVNAFCLCIGSSDPLNYIPKIKLANLFSVYMTL